MKTRFIFILLIAFACLSFARQEDKQQQPAAPVHQKSGKHVPSYSEVYGTHMSPDVNTDQMGILHPDKYGLGYREGGKTTGHRWELDTLLTEGTSPIPYVITANDLDVKRAYRHGTIDQAATNIQRSWTEMMWTRTTRARQYEYVTRLNISSSFYTFIIRADDEFDLMGPVSYYLTNVDANGYFLSSLCIASHDSPLKLKTATVSADGTISCATFKQIWEKDPLESGYENNHVKERKTTGEKKYKITADGDIVAR